VRAERGASQILFGMLPTQTVDLEGGVWRVTHWADPVPLLLDQTSVRMALLEAIAPWAIHGRDGGVDGELRAHAVVQVVQINEDRGVVVERFPRLWRCRVCGRVTTDRVDRCRCGSMSIAQMQHVAYHTCGALQEPQVPRCQTHHAVAVRLPGTAAAREMYFFCPDCRRALSPRGFPFQPCACGAREGMTRNVHRAGAVFSPHYAVLVNPPDPAAAARLRASGGGARALEWVMDGLGPTQPGEGGQTVEGLVETLVQSGLSIETARDLAERAHERGEVARGAAQGEIDLPPLVRERAHEEALSLASALDQGRVRVDDMVANTTPPLRTLYETSYRDAIADAGLSNVELLTNFPVATLAFGFTRGGSEPTDTTLVAFRERGGLRAFGMLTRTEAILFQLDPVAALCWLREQGFDLPETRDPREARLSILRAVEIPRPTEEHPHPVGTAVVTLLHSYGHRLVRVLAMTAGVERDGLAEYLLPYHLSIVVYASARGQFVLGALQAMFETSLNRLLDDFVHGEARCPLDPGCRTGGGACMACLHLGEPSCRWFNRFLDRAALFGPRGFLAASRERG
jgi:hypothetical protein